MSGKIYHCVWCGGVIGAERVINAHSRKAEPIYCSDACGNSARVDRFRNPPKKTRRKKKS